MFEFDIDGDKVIRGLNWAVKQISKGGKGLLTCPSNWAYGKEGM